MFSFGKKAAAHVFELSTLEVMTIIANPQGQIEEANQSFLKNMNYSKSEVIGQNVHMLIPQKFMKKSNHEKLISRYTYGKPSAIIGGVRTMPMKNGDDEDVFMNVQILPFLCSEKKTDFKFICFFHEITINVTFDMEKKEELITEALSTMPRTENFKDSKDTTHEMFFTWLKIYISWEIDLLCTFISQNRHNPKLARMVKYFIMDSPLKHLSKARSFFLRHLDDSETAFLNAVALRLLFPVVMNNCKGISTVVESLRENLYKNLDEASSRSSASSTRVK